jgi:hypothetical protein
MYGLAYVLIPKQFASLQAELDQAMAPFMRGGDKEFRAKSSRSTMRRTRSRDCTAQRFGAILMARYLSPIREQMRGTICAQID